MSIPDNAITEYPDDDAIIIDDPRVFRGVLTAAEVWGSLCLDDGNANEAEAIDEAMAEFADKAMELRTKYELNGDLLNGESAVETAYYDELNELLANYRGLLFRSFMDYVSDDTAIDLMLQLLREPARECC